ncbi:MAG TPA: MaoC family dehydratase N-terminal domain-containing protein [Candidatus Binatia bacterium]|nr:MaoC family dehydratase N-terminal domain-containing protein [Candidatus Binatia bacterium]
MIPALDPRTVAVGQELPALVKGAVAREMLAAYAAASGDPNPMYTDDEFARNAGYPSVFPPGMLSAVLGLARA